jgi:MoaA/NifB/PqqE/SkfB family radical SAM enzyme
MKAHWIKRLEASLFFAEYWIDNKLLGLKSPFIGGLVINEKCNLNCLQCNVKNREGIADLSFEEAGRGLDTFRQMKIRNLYIEGGEPFLWKDREKKLEDIVLLAREKGFELVTIYTNGTQQLISSADTLFVSLDGMKSTNNYLRGNGRNIYDRVIQNIKESPHSNIIINYTINSINEKEIESFCTSLVFIPQVKGFFFYFHTPYFGKDKLYVTPDQKSAIIRRIRSLKKEGFPILNSYAGLKAVENNDWERPSGLSAVYASNKLYPCCRSYGNTEACENCGYLGFAEIEQVMKLKPSALWEARRYV